MTTDHQIRRLIEAMNRGDAWLPSGYNNGQVIKNFNICDFSLKSIST